MRGHSNPLEAPIHVDNSVLTAFTTQLEQWRMFYKLPGMAVTIASDEEVLHVHCSGITNLITMTPVTARTQFVLGPVSRTLTAEAVLQLVDQGHVHLDDPIKQHLPWMDTSLTVRELLAIPSLVWRDLDPSDPAWDGKASPSLMQWVQQLERLHPPTLLRLDAPPAGAAYAVLGALIEQIMSQPYATHMRDAIFAPLGMDDTTAFAEGAPELLANGHYAFDGTHLEPVSISLPPAYAPVGGIISTATDVGRYLVHQLKLSQASCGYLFGWTKSEQSLGQNYSSPRGEIMAVFAHEGHRATSASALLVVPSRGLGIGVLINAPTAGVMDIARSFLGLFLQ